MAAKAKQQTSALKKKKKHWFPILASIEFSNQEIGECYLDDASLLKGRKIAVNLMNLTKDPKKQNNKITFLVDEIKENKGLTKITGYETMPSHIKRVSKKAHSKVEDSFIIVSKDEVKMRIKPLITFKNKVSRPLRTKIRLKSREATTRIAKDLTHKEILKALLSNNLANDVKKEVKTIVPINSIIFKSAYLL